MNISHNPLIRVHMCHRNNSIRQSSCDQFLYLSHRIHVTSYVSPKARQKISESDEPQLLFLHTMTSIFGLVLGKLSMLGVFRNSLCVVLVKTTPHSVCFLLDFGLRRSAVFGANEVIFPTLMYLL
jgi:hypothetical protein